MARRVVCSLKPRTRVFNATCCQQACQFSSLVASGGSNRQLSTALATRRYLSWLQPGKGHNSLPRGQFRANTPQIALLSFASGQKSASNSLTGGAVDFADDGDAGDDSDDGGDGDNSVLTSPSVLGKHSQAVDQVTPVLILQPHFHDSRMQGRRPPELQLAECFGLVNSVQGECV